MSRGMTVSSNTRQKADLFFATSSKTPSPTSVGRNERKRLLHQWRKRLLRSRTRRRKRRSGSARTRMPLKRPVWMMGKESSTMHILFETLPCVRKIYNCIYIPSRHVLPARDARNANATSVMILLYEVRRHSLEVPSKRVNTAFAKPDDTLTLLAASFFISLSFSSAAL